MDLEGRVAIISGGAMGIGRGIAETLCSAGAQVVIADRHRNEAESVATRLRKREHAATAIEADVADETSST